MSKIRVGVLRGGVDGEYEVSLKTGAHVMGNLPKDIYKPVDIFVDRDGVWHIGGLPKQPDHVAAVVDVVFNALHGAYGEDGKVQQILETHRIPYTGSGIQPSAVGMNKILTKEAVKKCGIKSPYHQLITKEEFESSNPRDLFWQTLVPVVIKVSAGGSSLGVSFAQTMEELWEGINEAFNYGDTVMLEQYIKGKETTVGVIDEFRGKEHYALLPVEIEWPSENNIWGYEDKYSGETFEYCPGRFSDDEKRELERLAILAHKAIGARHYSRSDFIVSPRGIYFLEINTLPGLTPESLLPKALAATGATFPQFLDHVIKLAMNDELQITNNK